MNFYTYMSYTQACHATIPEKQIAFGPRMRIRQRQNRSEPSLVKKALSQAKLLRRLTPVLGFRCFGDSARSGAACSSVTLSGSASRPPAADAEPPPDVYRLEVAASVATRDPNKNHGKPSPVRSAHHTTSRQRTPVPRFLRGKSSPQKWLGTLTCVGRIGTRRGRGGEVEEEIVLGGDVDEGEPLHGRC